VWLPQVDLTVASGGLFGHRRFYGNQAAYDGPNGFNWWLSTLPYAASVGASTVAIVFDTNRTYWFDKSGTTYTPRYPWLKVSLTEDTTAKTFTFTDTSAGHVEVTVLNSLSATTNPGAFISYTNARGIQTTITSQTGSQVNELQRSYTIGGTTIVDSLQYAYFSSGSAAGKLQSVTYRQQVGGG